MAKARIRVYLHCATCMQLIRGKPVDKGEKLAVGWTSEGLQVFCEGCNKSVMDLDFKGQKVEYYQKPKKEKK